MRKQGLVLLGWAVVLSGCASVVKVPEVSKADGSLNPQEAWKSVLAKRVDDRGFVDFYKLKQEPNELLVYVNWIGKVSPKSNPEKFPTPQSKLAYYINSYNALAMYNMIEGEVPKNLDSTASKAKYFYLRKFVIGGEEMSLYKYENELIRPLGDERAHFALNCMSGGCPRLPKYPFPTEGLDQELDKQTRLFMSEDRNIQVDAKKKQVRVSEILKWYSEDFLKKTPTITAYINKWRKEKIPEDFKVEHIPYDWNINIQKGTSPAKSLSKQDQSESSS